MSDLISREAAIDAIEQYDFVYPKYMERFVIELRDAIKADLKDDIEELPSAHPELDEWCTDCKEYDQERHCCPRYNRVIRESLEEISITRCKDCKHWKVSQNNTCGIQICYLFGGVREEYDFCSRGEKA